MGGWGETTRNKANDNNNNQNKIDNNNSNNRNNINNINHNKKKLNKPSTLHFGIQLHMHTQHAYMRTRRLEVVGPIFSLR